MGHVTRLLRARVSRLRQLRRSGSHRTGDRDGQADEARPRIPRIRAIFVRRRGQLVREHQRASPEKLAPARKRYDRSGRLDAPDAPVDSAADATAAATTAAAATDHGHVALRYASPSAIHAHGVSRPVGRRRCQPRGRSRRGHEQNVGAPAAKSTTAATHGPSHSKQGADR